MPFFIDGEKIEQNELKMLGLFFPSAHGSKTITIMLRLALQTEIIVLFYCSQLVDNDFGKSEHTIHGSFASIHIVRLLFIYSFITPGCMCRLFK